MINWIENDIYSYVAKRCGVAIFSKLVFILSLRASVSANAVAYFSRLICMSFNAQIQVNASRV